MCLSMPVPVQRSDVSHAETKEEAGGSAAAEDKTYSPS